MEWRVVEIRRPWKKARSLTTESAMKNSTTRMGNNWPLKSWGYAILLLIPSSTRALFGADAARQTINPFGLSENTLRSLERNKQKQMQAVREWKAFHDFQF